MTFLRWSSAILGFSGTVLAWAAVKFDAVPTEDAFTLLASSVFCLGVCAIVLRD